MSSLSMIIGKEFNTKVTLTDLKKIMKHLEKNMFSRPTPDEEETLYRMRLEGKKALYLTVVNCLVIYNERRARGHNNEILSWKTEVERAYKYAGLTRK